MKIKRLFLVSSLALALSAPVVLSSCGDNNTMSNVETPTDVIPPVETKNEEEEIENSNPKIYLAGDSTVKTYETDTYIAGWGQYMDLFLDDVEVINCANGGRSSRSFINEGRLYDIEGCNYSFSQNNGNSIGDVIEEGDYLFIQFGHNDDNTKYLTTPAGNYSTLYDRMVPLGEKDSNGKYPVTEGVKVATTSLPEGYTKYAKSGEQTTALNTIKSYGSTYYSYDSGSYKWYLKQYIDFAREKKATPVLVTPVARVSFESDGSTLKSGPGLHGDNFAYVEAVRQLAEEEGCLLMDMFAETKEMLEITKKNEANYLMALKPNGLIGTWPSGYDYAYENTDEGYEGIEATHYNKYGAFLTAGAMAKEILEQKNTVTSSGEKFNFTSKIKTTPTSYIDPSSLMTRSTASKLEALNDKIDITNPNRTSRAASTVVDMINELPTLSNITNDNYESVGEDCIKIRKAYAEVNIDDRADVTNLKTLEDVETKVLELVEANRPTPTKTVMLDLSSLEANSTITSNTQVGDFYVVGTADKAVNVKSATATYSHNGISYSVNKVLSMGGSASYGTSRYIEFTTSGACSVTAVVASTGDSVRAASIVNKNATSTVLGTFTAPKAATKSTLDLTDAGTYQIGSTGSGIYIYAIIIEYFS